MYTKHMDMEITTYKITYRYMDGTESIFHNATIETLETLLSMVTEQTIIIVRIEAGS